MRTEEEFDFIDESLRGLLPPHLWYQFTVTLNPWNKQHWIKKRFFDPIYGENEEFLGSPQENDEIFAITTNYLCNEFNDESFLRKMLSLKARNPKRYMVAGLGKWGVTSGLIYSNFDTSDFKRGDFLSNSKYKIVRGLDFGYTNDPTAFIELAVDEREMLIYPIQEFYKTGMSNLKISEELKMLGKQHLKIIADSSEPKSIDSLRRKGIANLRSANKGNDSVNFGIDKLQDYKFIINPKLTPNFFNEINNYIWNPLIINEPIDDFNHLMDAMRYATEGLTGSNMLTPYKVLVPKKHKKRVRREV